MLCGLDDPAANSQLRKEVFLRNLQTGSGTHPTSYLLGTEGHFSEGKTAGVRSWPVASN